jgi:hypothetical protein
MCASASSNVAACWITCFALQANNLTRLMVETDAAMYCSIMHPEREVKWKAARKVTCSLLYRYIFVCN